MAEGLIAFGDVDERDIRNVEVVDLEGYTQCHFFAGIGGWSVALRLAGWPDDRPVWTGSPPCQPYSTAGKGLGQKDERHLAPCARLLKKIIKSKRRCNMSFCNFCDIPILLPCPFCGSDNIDIWKGEFSLYCVDCGAIGPEAPNATEAVKRWNSRFGKRN